MDIGKKIAVIGAGLCGLKCAHDLGSRGASVTVFEKAEELAGDLPIVELGPISPLIMGPSM